jgi:hypothetical protein
MLLVVLIDWIKITVFPAKAGIQGNDTMRASGFPLSRRAVRGIGAGDSKDSSFGS